MADENHPFPRLLKKQSEEAYKALVFALIEACAVPNKCRPNRVWAEAHDALKLAGVDPHGPYPCRYCENREGG